MLITIRSVKEATPGLPRAHREMLEEAGPVMGILIICAHLAPLQAPPSPSVVAAELTQVQYAVWQDVRAHLRSVRRRGEAAMGKQAYQLFSSNVERLAANPNNLLALTVPLFINHQMQTFANSPSRPQEVLTRLLDPIATSLKTPLSGQLPSALAKGPTNAHFFVPLIAGRRPFVLVFHSEDTLNRWFAFLEAATVLIIPQVVTEVSAALTQDGNDLLGRALSEELRVWSSRPPAIGQATQWSWLPHLV